MERDLELMRNILLVCENHEHGFAPSKIEISGFSDEQIGFHIHQLGQAGHMDVTDITTFSCKSPRAAARSITHDGYEFLDSIRDETIWEETQGVLAKAGGWTLSVAATTAAAILTNRALALIGSP